MGSISYHIFFVFSINRRNSGFSNVNIPFQWRGMIILHNVVVKSVSYFTSKYFDTRFRSIYLPLVSYSKSLKLFFLLLSFSRQMGKIRTCTGFSTKGRAEMYKQVWQVVVKLTRLDLCLAS
jgi:hypothetical protein